MNFLKESSLSWGRIYTISFHHSSPFQVLLLHIIQISKVFRVETQTPISITRNCYAFAGFIQMPIKVFFCHINNIYIPFWDTFTNILFLCEFFNVNFYSRLNINHLAKCSIFLKNNQFRPSIVFDTKQLFIKARLLEVHRSEKLIIFFKHRFL